MEKYTVLLLINAILVVNKQVVTYGYFHLEFYCKHHYGEISLAQKHDLKF